MNKLNAGDKVMVQLTVRKPEPDFDREIECEDSDGYRRYFRPEQLSAPTPALPELRPCEFRRTYAKESPVETGMWCMDFQFAGYENYSGETFQEAFALSLIELPNGERVEVPAVNVRFTDRQP